MSWSELIRKIMVEEPEGKAMAKKATPKRDPLDEAAERESKRGELIARLAEEVKMWRRFANGCKADRRILESACYISPYYYGNEMPPPPLSVRMDEITAPCWKTFAQTMASMCEQRLKEILG